MFLTCWTTHCPLSDLFAEWDSDDLLWTDSLTGGSLASPLSALCLTKDGDCTHCDRKTCTSHLFLNMKNTSKCNKSPQSYFMDWKTKLTKVTNSQIKMIALYYLLMSPCVLRLEFWWSVINMYIMFCWVLCLFVIFKWLSMCSKRCTHSLAKHWNKCVFTCLKAIFLLLWILPKEENHHNPQ